LTLGTNHYLLFVKGERNQSSQFLIYDILRY
jgi:hypothetical protein